MGEDDVAKILADSRKVLFRHRQTRPKPHRDDKIMTAWNGMPEMLIQKIKPLLGKISLWY